MAIKFIPLTKGQYAIVDEQDYGWINQWKWGAHTRGYAKRGNWTQKKHLTVLMHRELMECPKDMTVDHINGDTTDNRRENLRVCTIKQNNSNRRMSRANRSGFVGVHWSIRSRKWISMIGRTHLGCFDNPSAAARKYDAAAKRRYGEFARLNFPEPA